MNDEYNKINSSFRKKLVYNLGSEAGFFSEYNNMILCMLYCIKKEIKFELYSYSANFKIEKGLSDFFLPFCSEITDRWHDRYNIRQPSDKFNLFFKIKREYLKFKNNCSYLTSDLWLKFHNENFENEMFSIPNLYIKGDLKQATKKIIELTWRYNDATRYEIEKIKNKIELPTNYIGIHIRVGDKSLEYEQVEIEKYFNVIKLNSNIKNIFILTDDYKIIIFLKKCYLDYTFFFLCEEEENGYFHNDFVKLDEELKKRKLLTLFSSVDILSKAELFVGTFSSNIGMYLGMRMDPEKVKGVDFDNWKIW